MSRETVINTTVKVDKAISNIQKLKQAFQELNKTIEKNGKDGNIKVRVDLEGVDIKLFKELSNGFSKLGKGMEAFNKNISEVSKNGKLLNITTNNITNNVQKTTTAFKKHNSTVRETSKTHRLLNDEILSTIATWTLAQRTIVDTISAYNKLTDATYGVGIAGRMNLNQISQLNQSFIDLSTTVPRSATDLALAVDGLIRTGRSYDDARKIIQEVAKLSVASGDDLKNTSELVTKVMVSLGVNGDYAEQTLNTLHSVAIQTASDMKYLAGAFKSVAGSASVLVESSGYAGKQLDEYKQKMLSMNMAMIGTLANTGLSASESGTKVKNLISRMVTAEATAKKLFNEAMKINSVVNNEGNLFTYDDLSQLAKKDAPMAIQKLSELKKQGVLTDAVLTKLFTNRHGLDLANLLDKINGNVEDFVKNLSTGMNYIDDSAKSMFNINNQIEQFKNNTLALTQVQLQTVNDIGTGGLMFVNDIIKDLTDGMKIVPKELSEAFGIMTTSLVSATLGITAIQGAVKLLTPLFTGAGGIGAVLGTWALPVTAVIAGLSLIIKKTYDIKKSFYDISEIIKVAPNEFRAIQNEIDVINSKTSKTQKLLEDATDLDLHGVNTFSAIMDTIISKSKTLKEYLDSSTNMDLGYNFKQTLNDLSLIKKELENKNNLLSNIKNVSIDDIQKESIKKLRMDAEIGQMGILDAYVDKADKKEKALNLYFKYLDKNMSTKDIIQKIKEEVKGLSDYDIELTIKSYVDTTSLNKAREDASKLKKEIQELENRRQGVSDSSEKQAKANTKALNQLSALKTETLLEELMSTGSTQIGKSLISGLDGALKLTDEYLTSSYTGAINSKKNEVEKLESFIKEKYSTLKQEGRELSNDERKDIEQAKTKIELYSKQIGNTEKLLQTLRENGSVINKELNSLFKGIEVDSKNIGLILNTARLLIERNSIGDGKVQNELNTIINSYVRQVEYQDKQKKERQANNTKYQLKHISYLKEDLQLELETLKIGKSKQEQAFLEFEYKLKTLKVNKQLAEEERKNVLSMAKSYKAESSVGANYLSRALSSNSASDIQRLLNQFETKYSGIMIGDEGKKIKSDYDQIVKIMKATKQVEESGKKFSIEIKKGVSSIQNMYTSSIFEVMSRDTARYKEMYLESLANEFITSKNRVGRDFELGENFNLQGELLKSNQKINLLKLIGDDPTQIQQFKDRFISLFGEATYEAVIASEEQLALLFSEESNLMTALVELEKQRLAYNDKVTDNTVKQLETLGSMASLLSKMGDTFGIELFGDIGKVLESVKETQKFASNPKNNFSLTGIFDPTEFSKIMQDGVEKIDWTAFTDNLSKAFEGISRGMQQGNNIGSLVGGITGGGKSSQAAGALAGMATSALGMAGPYGMAIQAGAALIGGLLDKGDDGQAEAERKTKEANRMYNKNTEALQKLSQNMSNLNGGVEGLNNTLISSLAKLPTVGNLTRNTDALKSLYQTMDKTRLFESVSYQVQKHESGSSGFLGIGAKAGKSWTETYRFTPDEMLRKYGYKGSIDDMTSQEMRDFSNWLKDYHEGDSDNFSILGDAIENYAQALDKMNINVERLFKDSTMEAFEGISSIEQEKLKKQLEDFYKNLGLQIDDNTREQIDKLAEQMSVMVTVMQDVRSNFVKSWRESGVDAGRAFVTSMQPYIEDMLSNISQIYYDVYFSDVNKQLEDEFKNLSEKLVELKKKGSELDWKSISNELSGSFDKVISTIKVSKTETESFNTILLQLQKQAMDSGLSLSEIFDLGLSTETQKSVISTFKEALSSKELDSAFKSIGDMVGEKVGESLVNKMIDGLMGDKIFEVSSQMDKVLSGNLSFDSLAGLANDAMSVGTMLEQQRLRFEAIKSMFDFNGDITYENQNSNIEYSKGVSSQNTYNVYVNGTVEAGAVVESDSVERLLDAITDSLVEKLRVEKGIDLRKLQ